MGLTASDLRRGIERIDARSADIERELNAADAKLGDGDTGVMLRRVFEKLAAVSKDGQQDIGDAFRVYATASAAATGSSLGTLITTALLSASKATEGKAEVGWCDLSGMLFGALDAMAKRGGAKFGDKTVLDAVSAAAQAIRGLNDPESIRTAMLGAARGVLDMYRSRPCRIGRARMFAEKSVGLDDPGMLAFLRIVEAAFGEQPSEKNNRVSMLATPSWSWP